MPAPKSAARGPRPPLATTLKLAIAWQRNIRRCSFDLSIGTQRLCWVKLFYYNTSVLVVANVTDACVSMLHKFQVIGNFGYKYCPRRGDTCYMKLLLFVDLLPPYMQFPSISKNSVQCGAKTRLTKTNGKAMGSRWGLSKVCDTKVLKHAMAFWEVAPAPWPFVDANGFAKFTES